MSVSRTITETFSVK